MVPTEALALKFALRAAATALLALVASSAAAQLEVVAAGDIACDPADRDFHGGAGTTQRCRQRATSELALALDPDAVLLLGDSQYESGAYSAFQKSFAPSWGRLGARLRPAPGNHEYKTAGAAGYFAYFGGAAASGRYSFELGDWHFVSLDSNCSLAGGCDEQSPQARWLRSDLAAHAGRCTLAFWHHPRFSSGQHGDDVSTRGLWTVLQEAGADVVLNGHDHEYERFAPQTVDGARDPERGLREFVVGTGGKELRPFAKLSANSLVRLARFGVLRLRLRPGGYDWEFVDLDGRVADAGSAPCHGPEAEEALVLGGSRFSITAQWHAAGAQGIARPGPDATPSAGVLWFFDPANWELLVKVVDGCAINGHYWLFVSGLTDVGVSLRAEDRRTGAVRVVESAAGQPMPPVQDTAAFSCQ